MPELTVKTQEGSESGKLELSGAVFEADKNTVLVREVYNAWRANQRQGTHSTKTRANVRGGGRKPWRQKGTGRARQGSIRANQWRGGAIVFGPLPRDYREKINKKKKRGAIRAILSSLFEENAIVAVDNLDFGEKPKTKRALEVFGKLGAEGNILVVTRQKNEALYLSTRNLPNVKTQVVDALSIYDLLTCDNLVLEREALEALQERLS